jgi:hypothetical protein
MISVAGVVTVARADAVLVFIAIAGRATVLGAVAFAIAVAIGGAVRGTVGAVVAVAIMLADGAFRTLVAGRARMRARDRPGNI